MWFKSEHFMIICILVKTHTAFSEALVNESCLNCMLISIMIRLWLLERWMGLSNGSSATEIYWEYKLHKKRFLLLMRDHLILFFFLWWISVSINLKDNVELHIYFFFSLRYLLCIILKSLVAFVAVLVHASGLLLSDIFWKKMIWVLISWFFTIIFS